MVSAEAQKPLCPVCHQADKVNRQEPCIGENGTAAMPEQGNRTEKHIEGSAGDGEMIEMTLQDKRIRCDPENGQPDSL